MNPWGDVFHCFPVPEGPCGGPSQESHGWSSFPIIIPFEIPGALESWSLGQENTSSIATLAISVLGSHVVRIYFWDGPWEYPVFFFSLFLGRTSMRQSQWSASNWAIRKGFRGLSRRWPRCPALLESSEKWAASCTDHFTLQDLQVEKMMLLSFFLVKGLGFWKGALPRNEVSICISDFSSFHHGHMLYVAYLKLTVSRKVGPFGR